MTNLDKVSSGIEISFLLIESHDWSPSLLPSLPPVSGVAGGSLGLHHPPLHLGGCGGYIAARNLERKVRRVWSELYFLISYSQSRYRAPVAVEKKGEDEGSKEQKTSNEANGKNRTIASLKPLL